jgi:hypothetical protein
LAPIVLLLAVLLPAASAFAQQAPPPGIARLGVRITTADAGQNVTGVLYALDASGQAVADPLGEGLRATLDGSLVSLMLLPGGRPSIALVVAFLLDSSASPQARTAVANAVADGLQGIDVNRDTVAVVSTSAGTAWDQPAFTTSADALQAALNQVIQTDPTDSAATLEQVSNVLRALVAQQRDARVLLLITNRPLAGAASVNGSLGALRAYAVDNGVQVGIVSLPGAGGEGPAEAVADATPGGAVEYVLNATNREDIARRIGLLLAPVLGARRFQFAAPGEGAHVLSLGASGVALQAATNFQVTGRAIAIDSLQTSAGALQPDQQFRRPTWVVVQPAQDAPIDAVEWTVDGRVTDATTSPWALLLDPDQLGDGTHQVTARIISDGRDGPFYTTSIDIPPDFLRAVRTTARAWGLIVVLLIGEGVVVFLFLRASQASRLGSAKITEFPPTLRLNPLAGAYVAPEVIEFPARGKLRIGYHPPFLDNQVGNRAFSKLPYQDIRGDDSAVKDLSRHAACIWRDPKTNDCYIQLGWAGPGEPIRPKPQSQVFHFGRAQEATAAPYRLAHHDVVRLGTGVEFVFNHVGLRDKATPESKKLSPFEVRIGSSGRLAVLTDVARGRSSREEPRA